MKYWMPIILLDLQKDLKFIHFGIQNEWENMEGDKMLSECYDGKVLDWSFKKSSDGVYNFYIGDIYIGKVFRQGKSDWSVVSSVPHVLNPGGFRSRYAAADYMLRIWRGIQIKKKTRVFNDDCHRCYPRDKESCNYCYGAKERFKKFKDENEVI